MPNNIQTKNHAILCIEIKSLIKCTCIINISTLYVHLIYTINFWTEILRIQPKWSMTCEVWIDCQTYVIWKWLELKSMKLRLQPHFHILRNCHCSFEEMFQMIFQLEIRRCNISNGILMGDILRELFWMQHLKGKWNMWKWSP